MEQKVATEKYRKRGTGFLFVFLILIAGGIVVASFRAVRESLALLGEAERIEELVEKMSERRRAAESRLAEFQSPHALEREAKERWNMKRRGEEVVVVIPGGYAASSSPEREVGWRESVREKLRRFFSF
jgi:hypothetical protein